MSFSESEMLKPTTGHRKRNLSISSLCLGSICIGLTVGWPESSLSYVILTNCDDVCYDLSTDGSATIQMIMNFGSCIGALLPSYIADVYGRRCAFAVAALLNFTFWMILATWQTHLVRLQIICSAALGGFATGIYVTTTALYISEISLPRTRGTIGALAAFFAYAGALFGSCLVFVTYTRIISSVMALLAIMFLISVQVGMVESPYYFFMQGKTLEAKLSLKDLRGASTVLDVDEEFKTIELFITKSYESAKNSRNVCALQISSRKRKYATLGIIFLSLTQMVGAYGMDNYSEHFLNEIVPDYGRVIIASLDLCSVAVCLYVIEKFGRRKILLAISIVGSSISCLIMGIVALTDYGGSARKDSKRFSSLLPAAILGLYYLVYTLGLTPILPVLTGEIVPSRGKTVILGICISFIYFCSMVIQAIFEALDARQGSNMAFASFAMVGSLGIPVGFLFIPETRGKTLHEIQNELEDCTILVS